MENTVFILYYGGFALFITLFIIFEIKGRGTRKTRITRPRGYEYYTEDGRQLRIYHALALRYKIYVYAESPVPTKQDRYGAFFTINAWNAREVECRIDDIFRRSIAYG